MRNSNLRRLHNILPRFRLQDCLLAATPLSQIFVTAGREKTRRRAASGVPHGDRAGSGVALPAVSRFQFEILTRSAGTNTTFGIFVGAVGIVGQVVTSGVVAVGFSIAVVRCERLKAKNFLDDRFQGGRTGGDDTNVELQASKS